VVKAPPLPHVPPDAVDALNDPVVKESVKQAISLVRSMRRGDADERAVARAMCQVMNLAADDGAGHDALKQRITQGVQDQGWLVTKIVDRYAEKAADALVVANTNGGALRWYVQYCVRP
jgi:hypothetical protein